MATRILDCVPMVDIPISEYEALVRDSQTLDIIARYVASEQYVSAKDIQILLGMESEEAKNESV